MSGSRIFASLHKPEYAHHVLSQTNLDKCLFPKLTVLYIKFKS